MATSIHGLLPTRADALMDNFAREYLGHVKPGEIFFWQPPHTRIGMPMLCIWVSSSHTMTCPVISRNLLFNSQLSWLSSLPYCRI